ncbi:hypothetical protein [Mesorhizobium sp.]|uniref:hypothetical protein n=1 Tax=Mesorhizobium sp. TaxID=1871066 RepID=UPI0025B94082|nr:hypothetical protein [Mesorhizobium sp.]
MTTIDDQDLREQIEALWTQWPQIEAFPRADTHEDVLAVIGRLQATGAEFRQSS